MPTVEDVVAYLEKNYDKDQYIAADFWTDEDVHELAWDEGIQLNTAQVHLVLDKIHHNIDALDGLQYSVVMQTGDSMLYTVEDISEKDFAEASAMCLRGEELSLTLALCKVLSKKHGSEYVFGEPDVYCFVPKEFVKE